MADSVAQRKALLSDKEEIILRFAREKKMYLELKGNRK
jgi:hypothetical protein